MAFRVPKPCEYEFSIVFLETCKHLSLSSDT